MDGLIATLRESSVLAQAFAVTAGGLIGVFSTLGLFFLLIWVADKVGMRGK
ncbi:MAG: hypothetical protein M0001_13320 [Treponema sp.]|nr:hypothetical protein [Treponema sp.]